MKVLYATLCKYHVEVACSYVDGNILTYRVISTVDLIPSVLIVVILC